MSTYRMGNYGGYTLTDPTPAWYKDERYDYCEPFAGKKTVKSGKYGLKKFRPFHILFSLIY